MEKLFDIVSDVAYERFEQCWVVGGYVRDELLDRPNKDIDFVVIGDVFGFVDDLIKILNIPKESVNIFPRFGTVNFKYEDLDLEFVRARRESYDENSRKPDVVPGTLEEDLARRDFTINTLAKSLNRTTFGEIVDYCGGRVDLDNGLIRTPLHPRDTFSDDPLRIMRMVRFASQLGFEIHEGTLQGAKDSIERLKIISQERITDEFMKILKSDRIVGGLETLMYLGAFDIFLPELVQMVGQEQRGDYHHKDVWGHTLDVIRKIAAVEQDQYIRLAALFHDIGKIKTKEFKDGIGFTFHAHEIVGAHMIPEIFDRLKLPHDKLALVQTLVGMHGRFRGMEDKFSDSAVRRLINESHPFLDELLILFICDFSTHNNRNKERIEEANRLVIERIQSFKDKESQQYTKLESLLNGNEIMELLKIEPGPKIKEVKAKIVDAMIEGQITTKEEATAYVMGLS